MVSTLRWAVSIVQLEIHTFCRRILKTISFKTLFETRTIKEREQTKLEGIMYDRDIIAATKQMDTILVLRM